MRSGIWGRKDFIKNSKLKSQKPTDSIFSLLTFDFSLMFIINLHNLNFFSFHGVHEEERILGNNFVVHVSLSFNADENISSLQQTINYASVYKIIKQRMSIPTALLETLAQDLAQEIYVFDKRIKSIYISVEKKDPPIPNISGSVSVNYKKGY
jgi:dihydroneopterin aldolase